MSQNITTAVKSIKNIKTQDIETLTKNNIIIFESL